MENIVIKKDLEIFVNSFCFEEEIKNKTFLITGSTGLIGSTLIKCLLEVDKVKKLGIKIVSIARSKNKAYSIFGNSPIIWYYQDMMDPLVLDSCLNVDYVIQCASSTSSRFYVEHPVETINTAFLGTNNLLRYSVENKVKGFVYLSSLESYGTIMDKEEIIETDMGYINPLDVRSGYSLGKRMVECLCHSYAKEYGLNVTIARLTQTFGAGVSLEDNRVFAQFSKSIIKNEPIIMHTTGESSKPYCYTVDAVRAILYMLFKGESGQAYNVANSDSYISIHDLAVFLCNDFNKNCNVIVELKDNMGYAPITKLNLNTEKLKSLGWKPLYSLHDMFSQLIDYYKTF